MTWLSARLLTLLLVALTVIASCPDNCGSHGSCENNSCRCQPNWTGTDCSIEVHKLTNGQLFNGSVSTFEWVFFVIDVPVKGTGLIWQVNQTSSGDVDVYIRHGDLPTRSTYDFRDIGIATVVTKEFADADDGSWYLGVYGFFRGSFSVSARLTGDCPNSCSGHGNCLNSNCQCQTGWTGEDCSLRDVELSPGVPVNGSVAVGQWAFYHVDFKSGNVLEITMGHQGGEDCDLYVKYQSPPTFFSWDFANATLNVVSTIHVENPTVGYWYAGVYGFTKCDYSINVAFSVECPGQCSHHGSCVSASACTCDTSYEGKSCESYTKTVGDGEVMRGYVDYDEWNYYFYDSNTIANLLIDVEQESDPNADCDVYVRRGQKPSLTAYDYADLYFTQSIKLEIQDPGQDRWYVGVYGWDKCQYNLTISESEECPNDCSGHGSCLSGSCVCYSGYSGDGCNSTLTWLTSGSALPSQAVSNNAWRYFAINSSASSLHVEVRERSTSGFVWLFAAEDQSPDLRVYDQADTSTRSPYHRLQLATSTARQHIYYIGVYGSPFAPSDNPVLFDVVAWTPPFR